MLSGSSSLKSKVDELDIVKLETTPVDLTKLSDVVKSYILVTLPRDLNTDLLIWSCGINWKYLC